MDKEVVAWDSCIVIDAIQKEASRYPEISPMLRKAEADNLLIVLSTASIAEILYLKELSAKGISQEDQNDMIQKWLDNPYIVKRAADLEVCTKAAEIRRVHGSITPVDSIILSTAVLHNVDALVTYDGSGKDGRLLQLNEKIDGLKIIEPGDSSGQAEMPLDNPPS